MCASTQVCKYTSKQVRKYMRKSVGAQVSVQVPAQVCKYQYLRQFVSALKYLHKCANSLLAQVETF